jgi:hypothetical protein
MQDGRPPKTLGGWPAVEIVQDAQRLPDAASAPALRALTVDGHYGFRMPATSQ